MRTNEWSRAFCPFEKSDSGPICVNHEMGVRQPTTAAKYFNYYHERHGLRISQITCIDGKNIFRSLETITF